MLEKSNETGAISTDSENHNLMTRLRAEKVAKIADSIPDLKVEGNQTSIQSVVLFQIVPIIPGHGMRFRSLQFQPDLQEEKELFA